MARKKPTPEPLGQLSRREREIMDVVYARGRATSMEVLEAIPNPPSYSAIRALMKILVKKGQLRHRRKGLRYVFEPVLEAEKVRSSALLRVMQSFFENSPFSMVTTLLDARELKISADELQQLKDLIAKKEAEAREEP